VCREGAEQAERHGLGRTLARTWAAKQTEALVALGRWDDAEALAAHLLTQDLPHVAESVLCYTRAEMLVRRGDPDAAAAAAGLDRVTRWFPEGNDLLVVAMVRAEHSLADRDADAALSTMLAAVEQAGPRVYSYPAWPALHTLARAIIAVEQGSGTPRSHARDVLTQARQTYTPSGIQQVWDAVLDAELAPSRPHDAPEQWQAAFRELTAPDIEGPAHLRAYTAYQLGSALLTAGRAGDAMPVLTRALDEAQALRAAPSKPTSLASLALGASATARTNQLGVAGGPAGRGHFYHADIGPDLARGTRGCGCPSPDPHQFRVSTVPASVSAPVVT